MRHPDVPEELRGTYRGLAEPAVTDHLLGLGVTAVELLPVHQFVHDRFLADRGLRNYWGYQSIGYFAPHNEYGSADDGGGQIEDFKAMVLGLHAAGLQVILDVVYNHTAEGGERRADAVLPRASTTPPTTGSQDDRSQYVDDTGTGNTVDSHKPAGAAADHGLAALLGAGDARRRLPVRPGGDARPRRVRLRHPLSAFLEAVGQDPVLATVKLIAEPWDIGYGGYEVGDFPPGWSEWNGRYRDTVRDFWRGDRVDAWRTSRRG